MKSRLAGLTLIESMIAMLMLGIGLVGVASLIPVAGAVQRSTYDDVIVNHVGHSVTDAVEARGFNALDLIDPLNPLSLLSFEVRPVPKKILNGADPAITLVKWDLADRCYPSAMGGDPTFENRQYYWVPLVRRANLTDWQIFVFILKKDTGVDYGSHVGSANPTDPTATPMVRSVTVVFPGGVLPPPKGGVGGTLLTLTNGAGLTLNATEYLQAGDKVLDSQGVVHTVLSVDSTGVRLDGTVSPLVNALWYSKHPTGGQSPTRRIMTFGTGIVLN